VARRIHAVLTVVAITVCMGLAGLATSSGTASAQPASGSTRDGGVTALRARVAQARTAMVQARLDEAAARLEIRASQEPAWNTFTAAVKAYFAAQPGEAGRPARAADRQEDAAALLHRLATADLSRAQNLQRLADATTRLQAALDPNQREVLNEVVRMQLGRGRGGFGFVQRRVIVRTRGPDFGPPTGNQQFFYRSFGPGQAGGPAQFRRFGGADVPAPPLPPTPPAAPDPPPAPDPGTP
jgi:hypothetical protein